MTSPQVDRKSAAQVLEQVAAFLELKGENPFRIRAFRTAAKALVGLPVELREALADGTLAGTRGIGPATLQLVSELVSTGRSSLLEELRGQVPPGLVDMLQIPGLGVAKVRQVHETLGVDSIADLEQAALDGSLARLPRFGQKTAENILKGIRFLRQASEWRLSHHAEEEAGALRTALAQLRGAMDAIVAGDVRRCAETVRDIVVVVVSEAPAAELFQQVNQLPGVSEFAGRDERRVTLRFAGGGTAQVVVTPPPNLGAVLVQATGSEAHLALLATRAAARGMALTGAAVWKGSTFIPTPDEPAFYRALELDWIPPELREGRDEVDLAAAHQLPRLVGARDLRGFLHCHTPASDGTNSIEQLAHACREAGYEYIGITDHSQSAAYAGGLSPADLERQWDEIDGLNATLDGIRVLKGIEADILQDGALDYPDDVLARLDFVIGSVHSRFNMSAAEMTARMMAAMDHPALTIVGHPTGRLLLSREPYALDLDRVIAHAAARGVALEINGDPHRLDLDWRVLPAARAAGVMLSIGADAHSIAGLAHVHSGIAVARKGGLGPQDVLNTRSVEEFLAFARARR